MRPAASSIYLDYSASAPLRAEAREAMIEALTATGNAASVHGFGRAQRHVIDEARAAIARHQGVKPENLIFTSSATEANNMALKSFSGHAIITSAIEHPSILQAAAATRVRVDAQGRLDLNHLEDVLKAQDRPVLLSLMLVNNETGVIQPVAEAARLAHEKGALVHCDAVQAFGRMPVSFADLDADMMSFCAHKIGGPQGVGALIVRDGLAVEPLLVGGGQELRRRAGTENVAGIAGFAAAIKSLDADLVQLDEWTDWRDGFEAVVRAQAPDTVIFGAEAPRVPTISCLAMPHMANETQLMAFDLAGYAVSSGAACSSGKVEASHVLKAMGADPAVAKSAIRLSFGFASVSQDLTGFAQSWLALYHQQKSRRAA